MLRVLPTVTAAKSCFFSCLIIIQEYVYLKSYLKKDESVFWGSSGFSAMYRRAPIPTARFSSPCWFSDFMYSTSVRTDTDVMADVATNFPRNKRRSLVISGCRYPIMASSA